MVESEIVLPLVLSNHTRSLASIAVRTRTLEAAAGKSYSHRRKRLAVRGDLRHVAIPQGVVALRSDDEIGAAPRVALAVEHHFGATGVTTTGELWRQSHALSAKLRYGMNGAGAVLAVQLDELIEEREDALRLVGHIVRN